MLERIEKAKNLHRMQGCNCAQSVAVAFHDKMNIDEDTAFRISEGLGKGCAVETICGALTGCIMVISAYYSDGLKGHGSSKMNTYEKTKAFLDTFKENEGTIICSELKARLMSNESKATNCTDYIVSAIRIMEDFIKE
ncbi:MAG: C_GCAxxG_C_C family protein [Erysipelotrichales bacterium]|nr:C_GCAxxG_C_C family protein [Erysipelotrichales bacterium]